MHSRCAGAPPLVARPLPLEPGLEMRIYLPQAPRWTRREAWQAWVKGNLKSKARSVYAWAKRISPVPREETLNWNTDECPVGIGTRVERGITESSSFWTSGDDAGWQDIQGPALQPN